MPAKSFLMAIVFGGWLVALVVAGLIVAYTSFFGIAVLGLIILCFSVIVDQDRDGAVGTGTTPNFLAQQIKARAEMTRAQQRVFRAEQALEARSTRLFRYFAVAMILIGSGGFWFFQM